ncbi:MAG: sulfite exporter TauE/SafE family protein [Chloroflexi bacterium]|nr:sulfite exporter TauE/SafE family protein [Chloroflexota bacterium]
MIDLFPLDASPWQLVILGGFTFVMGFIAGMVGVALGAVRLPVMLAMGFNPVIAAGTNLGVTILSGTAASWPHWREGRVVARVVLVIGLPTIIGSLLGGLFADEVIVWMLLSLIASLTALSSAISFWQWWAGYRRSRQSNGTHPAAANVGSSSGVNLNPQNQALYGGIGLVIGIIGGAGGLVMAVLRFPILINVIRMDPRRAAGTNNVIGVLAGIFGFIGHAVNMNFDISVLAVMGITGMIGSFFGARLTGRVSVVTMRLIIAFLLAASTPIVVVRVLSEYPN